MDRSFLSSQAVVTASRRFVCARLATYEDAEESKMLAAMARTGSGQLENSVFALLAPDGVTRLARTGRSIRQVYGSAAQMAQGMDAIAQAHPGSGRMADLSLPLASSVPIGLTVAAADSLPLVVLPSGVSDEQVASLAKVAWRPDLAGRLQFARLKDASELAGVKKTPPGSSDLLVIAPDEFAQGGEVIATLAVADPAAWEKALRVALEGFKGSVKTMSTHIPEGKRLGVFYDPAQPVTDPMELRARERNRPRP